ncbi:hypothetical protein B0T20DRAFT_481578 [Sordaria brevicollis]|uniref:Uncharacterized protein n=1 Tax=Sordaria brevicollis TaxID=83679 RepID=A0AAE0PB22_SORBR|nr:hypothetical protein B0T20DRAFT_481578 [Sordaria brevicollis]
MHMCKRADESMREGVVPKIVRAGHGGLLALAPSPAPQTTTITTSKLATASRTSIRSSSRPTGTPPDAHTHQPSTTKSETTAIATTSVSVAVRIAQFTAEDAVDGPVNAQNELETLLTSREETKVDRVVTAGQRQSSKRRLGLINLWHFANAQTWLETRKYLHQRGFNLHFEELRRRADGVYIQWYEMWHSWMANQQHVDPVQWVLFFRSHERQGGNKFAVAPGPESGLTANVLAGAKEHFRHYKKFTPP